LSPEGSAVVVALELDALALALAVLVVALGAGVGAGDVRAGGALAATAEGTTMRAGGGGAFAQYARPIATNAAQST
jgi:hypothetical protein